MMPFTKKKKKILGNRPCRSTKNIVAFHQNVENIETDKPWEASGKVLPESLYLAENRDGLLSKSCVLFIENNLIF